MKDFARIHSILKTNRLFEFHLPNRIIESYLFSEISESIHFAEFRSINNNYNSIVTSIHNELALADKLLRQIISN